MWKLICVYSWELCNISSTIMLFPKVGYVSSVQRGLHTQQKHHDLVDSISCSISNFRVERDLYVTSPGPVPSGPFWWVVEAGAMCIVYCRFSQLWMWPKYDFLPPNGKNTSCHIVTSSKMPYVTLDQLGTHFQCSSLSVPLSLQMAFLNCSRNTRRNLDQTTATPKNFHNNNLMTNGWYNQHSLRINASNTYKKKHHLTRLVHFGVDQPLFSPNSGNRLIFIHRATSKLETFQRTRVNGMAWMHRINPSHRGVFLSDPNNALLSGKSLKITIHLHCSIPPQKMDMYNLWSLKQQMESTGRFDLFKFTDLRVHGLSLGLSPL